MEFNAGLDREARPENLNERFLEGKLEELDRLDVGQGEHYWLTLARITEFALFCAGTYADNGEFAAAGDLLVNPRLIVIHVRGLSEPLVKNRRGGVTCQLRHLVPTGVGVIEWLKGNTWVEIRKEPLLPQLYQRLERSGFFPSCYLEWVERRMKRVADVIAFLASWDLPEGCDVGPCLRSPSRRESAFVEENLCRFSWSVFVGLGEELGRLGRDGTQHSRSTCQSAGVLFRDASRPPPPFAWPGSLEMIAFEK